MCDQTTEQRLKDIMAYAAKQRKGSYPAYEQCKRQLEILNLSSREYEQAIIKIAKMLKI